jgi:hypothetical protein
MSDATSEETKPLLSKSSQQEDIDVEAEAATYFTPRKWHESALRRHLSGKGFGHKRADPDDIDNDVMLYRNRVLATWKAFHVGPNSVWRSYELWSMMLRLGGVALVTALLTVLLVPDPAALQVSKFTEVSKFLNIIIGLMMGFFLSSSTKRWHNCVNGFLTLLDAIRNLQMQNKALGVPMERSIVISRYGMASAWLLFASLLTQWQRINVSAGDDLMGEAWELFKTHTVTLDDNGPMRLLTDKDIESLREYRDPPSLMWMRIASLIGKLSQDGLVPAMQSPTYGRIMGLCQNGHGGIRTVRAAICVQAPLPYTHTLAILVHVNNLLNAVTLGLVFGCSFGTVLIRYGWHYYAAKATHNEESRDLQMIGVTFLYCFFGPLLYQGLLLIGFHLAQPFDHEDTSVPLDLFLHRLELDIQNGNQLCERLPGLIPGFKMPCFKAPPKAE